MKKTLLVLALLCLDMPAFAASASEKQALKSRLDYLDIKDDNDLYVGQGAATLKDKGDWDKAELAATAAARASLAEAIEVRIQSQVTDKLEGNSESVTASTTAITKTESDLKLANVQLKALRDFPSEGTLTVLAYLSKADYRRQLAGKSVAIYRPQYGLKLAVWGWSLPSIEKIEDSGTVNGPPTDAPLNGGNNNSGGGGGGGGSSTAPGLGLEFVWQSFSLGLDFYRKELSLYRYDDILNQYNIKTDGISVAMVSLGWQYIPWNWRFQPFVPLAVHVAHVNLFQGEVLATAASAGLGLRYWPSDAFSFELCGRYLQGFNNERFQGNGPIYLRKGKEAEFSLTGPQIRAAIQWSGF